MKFRWPSVEADYKRETYTDLHGSIVEQCFPFRNYRAISLKLNISQGKVLALCEFGQFDGSRADVFANGRCHTGKLALCSLLGAGVE